MQMIRSRTLRLLTVAALGAMMIPAFAAEEKPAKKPAAGKEAPEKAAAEQPAKANVAAAKPNAPEEPKGMTPMIKGDTLEGWDGNMDLWRVENGVVIGQTTPEKQTKGNTFLLWKGGEVKDFELRFSFRIKGGNSGCQYRSHLVDSKVPENKWVLSGYQAEIENTAGKVGFLYHEKGPKRGYPDKGNYLCRVGDKVVIDETGKANVVGSLGDQAAIAAAYKPGDWNDYIIIAKGNHIQHYINGVQTVDLTDNDEKNRMMSGVIGLQIHQGPPMMVEFKELRIKQ